MFSLYAALGVCGSTVVEQAEETKVTEQIEVTKPVEVTESLGKMHMSN